MLLALALTMALGAQATDDHEYADLVRVNMAEFLARYVEENPGAERSARELEELFKFRDFVGTAMDGRRVNHHLPGEPGYEPARILLMSYTAEWCKNCNYEAPYLGQLYDRHYDDGLRIVTRTEYSALDKVREFVDRHSMKYPVLIGSVIDYDERETIRMETFQYLLRTTLGDSRKWGTPFTMIIVDGDIENPWIVTGEMKSSEVDNLIERTLSGSRN